MNVKGLIRPKFSLFLLLGLLLVLMLAPAAHAAVTTDQADYAPGSVVTISGDNTLLNDPWATGAQVTVSVIGPLGYEYASLSTTVGDEIGLDHWSCQFTLSDDVAVAVGEYAYTASAEGSFETQNGSFTDAFNFVVDSNPTAARGAGFSITTYKQNSTAGSLTDQPANTRYSVSIPSEDKSFSVSGIAASSAGYTYTGWTYGAASGTGTTISKRDWDSNRPLTLNYADKTAPVITAPDVSVLATGLLTPVTLGATASDGIAGVVPVTYWIVSTQIYSMNAFALGPTTVTAKATDPAGNTATKDFSVTVNKRAIVVSPDSSRAPSQRRRLGY